MSGMDPKGMKLIVDAQPGGLPKWVSGANLLILARMAFFGQDRVVRRLVLCQMAKP